MKKILLILWCFCNFSFANDSTVLCRHFQSGLKGGYCIHRPMESGKSPSSDLIYYLHGAGNSEFTWGERHFYPSQIRQWWRDNGKTSPTVISASFGPTWILAEKNSRPESGLLELFISKGMPEIEGNLPPITKPRRVVLGESMGGLNAAQLALKTQFFEKAAILCTPMSDFSPFSTPIEINQWMKKSSAWGYFEKIDPTIVPTHVERMLHLVKAYFSNDGEWYRSDPIQLARQFDGKKLVAFYVAAGFYDPYAVLEGNELFVRELKRRGAQVDWRPQWGGHCAMDIPTLSDFLVN